MSLYGADVAQLRDLADRLQRASDEIDRAAKMLSQGISATTQWQGPDASGFRGAWSGGHLPALLAAARALREAARAARANAEQQHGASTDGGGGLLGGLPGLQVRPIDGGSWSLLAPGNPFPPRGDIGSWFSEGGTLDTMEEHLDGVTVDKDGVHLGEKAEAEAVVRARAEGDFEAAGGLVSGSGSAEASIGAKAAAAGKATLGPDGASLQGSASASVGAEASASGDLAVGVASASAGAAAFAGARASGAMKAQVGPEGIGASVGVEAFAGAKAEGHVSAEAMGAEAKVGGEVYAGIGVEAEADVGYDSDTGELSVSLDLGVALGVGAGVDIDFSFSPSEAVADVKKFFRW